MDTAGIRDTEDLVEKIGVKRAMEVAESADLILYVVDSSVPLDENDREIMELIRDRKAVVLLNKSDLPVSVTVQELLKAVQGHPVISISAKQEEGLDKLEEILKSMFMEGEVSFNDQVMITNARHLACLQEAKKSLEMVRQSIEEGMPEDFFTIDLMEAYTQLGYILGEEVDEDLVNRIFKKFCMGK